MVTTHNQGSRPSPELLPRNSRRSRRPPGSSGASLPRAVRTLLDVADELQLQAMVYVCEMGGSVAAAMEGSHRKPRRKASFHMMSLSALSIANE